MSTRLFFDPSNRPSTLIVTICRSVSGVNLTLERYEPLTGSNHTVCQIPLVGVYQMPPDLRNCLTRGGGPASVGSQTLTTISLSPFACSTSVMSNVNAS